MLSDYLDFLFFFFFNDTATTEIYTLSLHDALPISDGDPIYSGGTLDPVIVEAGGGPNRLIARSRALRRSSSRRSEEHTSELQSQSNLVCRLLPEKKQHRHLYTYIIYSETQLLRDHT